LEQERQFLLRSLADLDAEWAAGDIEEDDYRTLSDDYTARAAAVLKAIDRPKGPASRPRPALSPDQARSGSPNGNGSRTPARPARQTAVAARRRPGPATRAGREDGQPGKQAGALDAVAASRRRWRTAAIVGAVVAFGGAAAWAVTESTSTRQAGQTITGNAQIAATPTTLAGGIDPRLTEAVTDATKGDYLDALKLYAAVLKDDPNQPVALANQGWLEAQIGLEGNEPDLVTTGMASILQAEKADPSYAEPHFFRGDVMLHDNNAPGAVTEFRLFLGLAQPGDPNIATAQSLLQQAIKAAGPNVPAGPLAATTTTAPTTTTMP
jgi:hypothetical protein